MKMIQKSEITLCYSLGFRVTDVMQTKHNFCKLLYPPGVRVSLEWNTCQKITQMYNDQHIRSYNANRV